MSATLQWRSLFLNGLVSLLILNHNGLRVVSIFKVKTHTTGAHSGHHYVTCRFRDKSQTILREQHDHKWCNTIMGLEQISKFACHLKTNHDNTYVHICVVHTVRCSNDIHGFWSQRKTPRKVVVMTVCWNLKSRSGLKIWIWDFRFGFELWDLDLRFGFGIWDLKSEPQIQISNPKSEIQISQLESKSDCYFKCNNSKDNNNHHNHRKW